MNEKQIDDNLNVKKQKNWLTSILENSYKLNPSNCTLDPSGKKVDEIKLSDVWDPGSWIIRTNLLKCDGMVFKNYIKQVSGQIEPKGALLKMVKNLQK